MAIFRPAMYPSSCSPCLNASLRESAPPDKTPMRGSPACCARAASGHVAAAPPSSDMNSRRFIQLPRRRGRAEPEEFRGRAGLSCDQIDNERPAFDERNGKFEGRSSCPSQLDHSTSKPQVMGLGSMTTLKEPSESGAGSEEGLQGRLAKDPEGTGLKLLQ